MNRATLILLLSVVASLGVACQEEHTEPPGPSPTSVEEHPHEEEALPREGIEEGRVRLSPEALEGQAFQTATVRRQPVAPGIRVTATIRPNEYKLAQISPRIEGKATAVMAELGDNVQPGQTLALLDSMELGQKKAAFLQARVNLKIARQNFEREQRLYKQRISSEKDYLDAKGEYERGVAAYRATREALRMIGVPEEEIRTMQWGSKDHPLSHFHLTAPFAGTVVARKITIGELIQPAATPFTIADLSTVWVLLDIFEKDLAYAAVGSKVKITVTAYPDERFEGTLTYLSNLLDPDTRTAQARVEIQNADGRLRPGMFATAAITVSSGEIREALVVPQSAIQRIDDKSVAFVEDEPGVYAVRSVTLGATVPPYVEVHEGLQEGDRIVTHGSFYLKSTLLAEEMGGHAH